MEPNASALVTYGILSIALIMAGAFVLAQWLAARRLGEPAGRVAGRTALGVALWLGLTAVLAASGVLSRWDLRPPPMAGMFFMTIALGLGVGFSSLGKRLSEGLPLFVLIAAQGFRFPLELVMHRAATEGVMPVVMSFSGYNFDILTGLSAIVVALLAWRGRAPRWLLLGFNLFGLWCLLVIAVVAAGSMPLLHLFGTRPDQLNTWVAYFPFVWLPASLVCLALAGHVIVLRKLALQKTALRDAPSPELG